jgi:alkanesulfonate monooxygenase SsuD/methylene tetrahydromethanopterin reductase-like flavin-dependent oxidoreductase (luciferase family)
MTSPPAPTTPRVRCGFVHGKSRGLDTFCPLADELGTELVTFADGQTLFHDPYVRAAVAAEHSSRMLVGPAVRPPGTRHPNAVACAISTVLGISGCRACVTLGTGDFALSAIGIRRARLTELEPFAVAVRGLCRGGGGRLRRSAAVPGMEHRDGVRVWRAADGPRLLALAGWIADGVISGNSATTDHVAFVRGRRSSRTSLGRSMFNRSRAGLENKGAVSLTSRPNGSAGSFPNTARRCHTVRGRMPTTAGERSTPG